MNRFFLTSIFLFFLLSCSGNKEQQKESEREEIMDEVVEDNTKPKSKYDTRQSLKKYFTRVDRGGFVQVLPNHVGKDGDGIYCFFLEKGERAVSLSLHIQYSKYNPDFYELTVGEETHKYESNKSQNTESNALIAEGTLFKWYAKMVNEEDEALIRKIGETGKATLKLYKNSGELLETIQLTQQECKYLLYAVDYYIALNGAKIPKKGMVNIRSF